MIADYDILIPLDSIDENTNSKLFEVLAHNQQYYTKFSNCITIVRPDLRVIEWLEKYNVRYDKEVEIEYDSYHIVLLNSIPKSFSKTIPELKKFEDLLSFGTHDIKQYQQWKTLLNRYCISHYDLLFNRGRPVSKKIFVF